MELNSLTKIKKKNEKSKTKLVIDGHMDYKKELDFIGDIEVISGRSYKNDQNTNRNSKPGENINNNRLCFVPGTIIENIDSEKINYDFDGTISYLNN